MSKKLYADLNAQLNREFQSAYSYMGMSVYCTSNGFVGAAHWMKMQMQEELGHGDKILNYLLSRDIAPLLLPISAPKNNFRSLEEVLKAALANELAFQKNFESLTQSAIAANDQTTVTFLQWFLTEQVEEIASFSGILQKLRLAGNDGPGLLLIDKELGTR